MTFFRVIRLPCCIDPKVQCMCNAVWDGFQVYACFDTKSFWHKWKLILIHILSRFDKRRSIRYKLKLFQSKSELAEIHVYQWKSFHVCIAYDRVVRQVPEYARPHPFSKWPPTKLREKWRHSPLTPHLTPWIEVNPNAPAPPTLTPNPRSLLAHWP